MAPDSEELNFSLSLKPVRSPWEICLNITGHILAITLTSAAASVAVECKPICRMFTDEVESFVKELS